MIEWVLLAMVGAALVYRILIYNCLVRDRQRCRAGWYHAHGHHGSNFSNSLSTAFNSAIASSSVAPGSSSGSSGGSSGGGGGGGGW